MANPFKDRLKAGPAMAGVFGGSLASSAAVEAIACHGADFVLIDLEHAPNDISTLVPMLQGVEAGGAHALVRAPWNDAVWIKRVLDAGGRNLMVPFVQSAEEARQAVRAVRYPPRGVRGVALSTRASRYGALPGYAENANRDLCLIVQIETAGAIDALEEIAAVDGVDALFIGPSDLAASMGHFAAPEHPEVRAKIGEALARAKRAGTPIGCFATSAEACAALLDQGFAFATFSTDLGLLLRQLRAELATLSAKGFPPRPPRP